MGIQSLRMLEYEINKKNLGDTHTWHSIKNSYYTRSQDRWEWETLEKPVYLHRFEEIKFFIPKEMV